MKKTTANLVKIATIGTVAITLTLVTPHLALAATQSPGDISFSSAIRKLQKPARLVAGFFAAWGFIIIAKGDSAKGLKRIYLALGGYAGIMGLNWIFDFIDNFFGW